MPVFTFSEYDIGNSSIVSENEGSLSFTTRTDRSFMDQPKVTTVTPSDDNVLGGVIDWKKKAMVVGGVSKPLSEVMRKTGGFLSLTREWKWSTKKYVASYSKSTWTVKCGEQSIAAFTLLKRHPFKKDELATLNFIAEVSNEEMVFLIFALLYVDLQLPPDQRPATFKGAAGEATGNAALTVAGNVAVTGLTTCCSIQ